MHCALLSAREVRLKGERARAPVPVGASMEADDPATLLRMCTRTTPLLRQPTSSTPPSMLLGPISSDTGVSHWSGPSSTVMFGAPDPALDPPGSVSRWKTLTAGLPAGPNALWACWHATKTCSPAHGTLTAAVGL